MAVAAVVYLLASLVFGRGEQLAPLPPGATPTRLPARGIEGDDVRDLRFQQVVRGYKAAEVDWTLDRLAGELDELRGQVAVLERQLDAAGEELHRSRSAAEPDPESGTPEDGERGQDDPA
nr:DivIVA domain-containing protein [Saccharopolyspora sp. HNM0983]